MHTKLKRVLAGVAAVAAASTGLLVTGATTNAAPGDPAFGDVGVSPATGDSGTQITLTPTTGGNPAVCPGNTSTGPGDPDVYLWHTFITPADTPGGPGALTFGAFGPEDPADPDTGFTQALFDLGGNPVINQSTAASGQVTGIPFFTFGSAGFVPGDIPAGTYDIGFACSLNGANTRFWSQTIEITTPGGGPVGFDYVVVVDVDEVQNVEIVRNENGELDVDFDEIAGGADSYDVTATPVDEITGVPTGAPATTANVTVPPATLTGLQPGQAYDVEVVANSAGNASDPSPVPPVRVISRSGGLEELNGTVNGNPVVAGDVLAATNGEEIELTVEVPNGGTALFEFRSDPVFLVEATDGGAGDEDGVENGIIVVTVTIPPTATSGPHDITVSILTGPGGSVTGFFTVAFTISPPPPDRFVLQEITVERPPGVLILTQRCGVNAEWPALPRGAFESFPGFPADLALVPAALPPGTSPDTDLGTPGVQLDPGFDDYPGPGTPIYPTECGIEMGTASPVADGPLAGQYFTADGVLNQVSVFDTRDTDDGWTVTGTFEDFEGTVPANTFDGNFLGWTPLVQGIDSAVYDNLAGPSNVVLPGTGVDGTTVEVDPLTGLPTPGGTPNEDVPGLKEGRALGLAPAGGGLGVTTLDARLALLIPTEAAADDYTATLSLSLA